MKKHPITIVILALTLGIWIVACQSGGGSGSYEPPPSAPSDTPSGTPSGTPSDTPTPLPTPESGVGGFLTGQWTGTWTSNSGGGSGPISAHILQNGTSIDGTATITVNGTPITGTLDGRTCNSTGPGTIDVGFAQSDGGSYSSQFHGAYTQNSINGTYTDSNGDTGTFTLTRAQ